jgi:hypothetical protein
VCGGRKYSNKQRLWGYLDAVHKSKGIDLIIEGGAGGADKLAKEWALDRGIPVCEFLANWNKHGKKAGPIRNGAMIKFGKPDGVAAFSGGRGTQDMKRQAMDNGIIVADVPD